MVTKDRPESGNAEAKDERAGAPFVGVEGHGEAVDGFREKERRCSTPVTGVLALYEVPPASRGPAYGLLLS